MDLSITTRLVVFVYSLIAALECLANNKPQQTTVNTVVCWGLKRTNNSDACCRGTCKVYGGVSVVARTLE